MTLFGIANILYNLATDIDYRDYEETQDKEIKSIIEDLEYLGEGSTLYKVIEMIVEKEMK